uniref:Small ribosomal subunit protein uS15m n=1 Tax=Lygus hesperus TaxID=30085 RepID=A0A0A9ZEE7_LYGHE
MSRLQLLRHCSQTLLRNNLDYLLSRNLSLSSPCALKSNLPIKWNRPEKIPCYKPEKSGDLEPLMELDVKSVTPLEFRDSEELQSADERIKRLFTLEFFPYSKTREVLREEYMSKVKRHLLDERSPEARISRFTANIRALQAQYEKCPQNKDMKVRLKQKIDKRKRLLLELREQDYKCYEYLLEKLNLEYKPYPPKTVYMRVERKRSLRMLTDEYCDKIINTKLDNYKKQLDSQKESFLENKIEKLKFIMKEEKECGAPPSVTECDIAEVEKQLGEWRAAVLKNKSESQ